MAYSILEMIDGNFYAERHIVDHNGEVMDVGAVVRRLMELEAKIELRESQLRTAGWCPLD